MARARTSKATGFGTRQRDGMTDQQKVFVAEYIVDKNASRAASAAGYKDPTNMGSRLLNANQNPLVCREVQKALAAQEKRVLKTADDILLYIHQAIFYNPLRFFKPGPAGGWLIEEDKLEDIPDEIGQLIEELEERITLEGKKHYKVRLVSKVAMVALAAKHQLTSLEKVEHSHKMDWSGLFAYAKEQDNVIDVPYTLKPDQKLIEGSKDEGS